MTVDPRYEIIYWVDYIGAGDSYFLMKTYFNGSTSQVKFYPGVTESVNVAIGEDNFYGMDSTRRRIDVFDRATATFQDSFFLSDSPKEITVVKGMKTHKNFNNQPWMIPKISCKRYLSVLT